METGSARGTVTDEAGRYLVLALPVGEYEVKVDKSGFQEEVRTGIHLVVEKRPAWICSYKWGSGDVRSEGYRGRANHQHEHK